MVGMFERRNAPGKFTANWDECAFEMFFGFGDEPPWRAGMLSLAEAIQTAYMLGQAGAECTGAMLHTVLSRSALDAWSHPELCVAAINGVASDGSGLSVTLSGPAHAVDAFLASNRTGTRLKTPHTFVLLLAVR